MHHYQKNQQQTSIIDAWGEKGLGLISRHNSKLQVPDVIPGEKVSLKVVKAGNGWAYGKLLDVQHASDDRVNAVCDVSVTCGGCQLQHVSYEGQLAYKKQRVVKAFQSKQLDCPGISVHGMKAPLYYRQKGQFAVTKTAEGDIHIGLTAARSQRVVDTTSCHLQAAPVNQAIQIIRQFLIQQNVPIFSDKQAQKGVAHLAFRWVENPAQLIVIIVTNESDIPAWGLLRDALADIPEFAALYQSVNQAPQWTVLGDELTLLWGNSELYQEIAGFKLAVSPLTFSQSNACQTECLWQRVSAFVQPDSSKRIWDLYCGSGGMSLYLAMESASVIAVEENKQAILDAKKNADYNRVDNCDFICADVKDVIQDMTRHCDALVVDPPRMGLAADVCDAIIQRKPDRFVYVSCSPESLVRDLSLFVAAGASIESVDIIDFFPQTYHVETVVLLQF